MNDSLSGLGVLVTRPAHQSENFLSLLRQSGAEAFALPAVEIQAITLSQTTLCYLQQQASYHVIIFISANAVRFGLPLLQKTTGPLVAAIGNGTAANLNAEGWQVDLIASTGHSSEDILALDALQSAAITGKSILIIRGEGGREFLAKSLQSRGANVDYAEVYRRVCPQSDIEWLAPLWQQRIQLVCVTSNVILENLYKMLQPYRNALLNTTLVVPGQRCWQLAQQLGFKKIIQSDSASDQDMLQSIMHWHQKVL